MMVFSLLEKVIKKQIDSLVGEGFNKRLGTEGLSIDEIAVEVVRRNMTFGDLFAIVEKDEWVYSDGPSMVCSAFVAGIYKAGGLLGDFDIQATE